MNAIDPSRLKSAGRAKAAKTPDDGDVRLTIEPEAETAGAVERPRRADKPSKSGKAGPAPDSAADPSTDPAPESGAESGTNSDAAADHAATQTHTPRPSAAAASGQSRDQLAGVPAQLAAIEVLLSVEVGSHRLPLRDLLGVEAGQLFTLDRRTSEPVTVLVNGRPFAAGEIVAIGEHFGVRLLDILSGDD